MSETDIRLGAIAALDLLLRAWQFGKSMDNWGPAEGLSDEQFGKMMKDLEGEDTWEEIAESIRDGIAADGLGAVVGRQLDFERGEIEEGEEIDPLEISIQDAIDAGEHQ